jgi:hypothetical protein
MPTTQKQRTPAHMPVHDERTTDVTSRTALAFDPAEEAEAIVEEAERDSGTATTGDVRAFLDVLVRPVPVLRAAAPTLWRSGLVAVAAAALLRTAAFTAFAAASGSALPSLLVGGLTGLIGPFAFAAVATGVLLASPLAGGRRDPATAASLAFLATMPVAVKALLQTGAMVVTRHALHPTGILGLIAPDSPELLLRLLGPVDLFALWAVALVVIAVWPVTAPKPSTSTSDAE